MMKFNYEFKFDVEEFAEYIEEDYFDDDVEFNEEIDKKWITSKLHDYCEDTDCLSFLIISTDIEDNTKKYYPQIVEKAYEILKKKYKKMKDTEINKELKAHLKAIKEYCENRVGEAQYNKCKGCPLYDYCGTFINRWEL